MAAQATFRNESGKQVKVARDMIWAQRSQNAAQGSNWVPLEARFQVHEHSNQMSLEIQRLKGPCTVRLV